jgi:uncharacterized membrane protein required for colicin V production
MLLDILIFIPVLTCILFGFRDGIVRKLVAIVILIAGLILGQLYMRDVGNLLAGHGEGAKEGSPINGFLIVFLGMFIVQALLYRLLAKNYKIGGFADKIGGIALGFVEGAIFVSALLFIFATSDFPDRNNKRDSQFYKSLVNIAPQILDMTSTIGPDAIEKPDAGAPKSIDKQKVKKPLPRSTEK